MSGNNTLPTKSSVISFINAVEDPVKRADCMALLAMMRDITAEEPVMWGTSIIGFGQYHYTYESGREGNWLITGFSPRKQHISLYVGAGSEPVKPLLENLGKHTTGKSCLYIKRLTDVNLDVLKSIIKSSFQYYNAKHN